MVQIYGYHGIRRLLFGERYLPNCPGQILHILPWNSHRVEDHVPIPWLGFVKS